MENYSAVIIVLHWLNAARILIAFKDKNDDMSYLLFKVVIFTWLILNASNVSVCYYACASPRLPRSVHGRFAYDVIILDA